MFWDRSLNCWMESSAIVLIVFSFPSPPLPVLPNLEYWNKVLVPGQKKAKLKTPKQTIPTETNQTNEPQLNKTTNNKTKQNKANNPHTTPNIQNTICGRKNFCYQKRNLPFSYKQMYDKLMTGIPMPHGLLNHAIRIKVKWWNCWAPSLFYQPAVFSSQISLERLSMKLVRGTYLLTGIARRIFL